jgi:hypothetical protein
MVPVVRSLQDAGARVTLAGSGAVASLLSAEFPSLELLHLEGYGIRYPRLGRNFAPYLLAQVPRVYNAISAEKVWLEKQLTHRHWDWVISDNRYGLHHPSVRSILVTHQLFPRSGRPWMPVSLLHRVHRLLMRPFNDIWVPDIADGDGLSGALSHPPPGDLPVTYIGPLSRLSPSKCGLPAGLDPGKFLLALISGPEPQRTIFEAAIRAQAGSISMPLVLVRGLPNLDAKATWEGSLLTMPHAPAEFLAALVSQAGWIICRSGYSTLMDLVKLGRSAMLVPTPGQPEQEYLAGYLEARGWFRQMRQEALSLSLAAERLGAASECPAFPGFVDLEEVLAKQLRRHQEISSGKSRQTPNPQ